MTTSRGPSRMRSTTPSTTRTPERPEGRCGTNAGQGHAAGLGPIRTPPLTWAITRADDGIRTRDPHLGKVVLYQLSHVRVDDHLRSRGTALQRARPRLDCADAVPS